MNDIRSEIVRDSKIYVSLEAAIKLVKWFFTLFLSWILSPTLFGVIGIIKIYEDFFPVLFTYGQNIVQQRYFYEYKTEFEKKKYFFDSVFITGFYNIFLVIVFIILISFFNFRIISVKYILYDYLLVSTILFLPIRIMVFNYYRLVKEKKNYIYYNLFFEIGRIVIFITIYFILSDVISSYIISLVVLSLLVFVELIRIFESNWAQFFPIKIQSFKQNSILGFFLSALTISSFGSFYIIRYFIEHELGLSFVGHFLLGFTLLQIIPFIARGINLAFIPIFFENMKENKTISFHYLKRITDANILVSTMYSTFVVIAFGLIKHIKIKGSVVSEAVIEIIPFIALSYSLSSIGSYLNQGLLTEKKEKIIGIISSLSLILLAIISFPLIKYMGFVGSGLSIVIFNLFILLLSYKYSSNRYFSKLYMLIISITFIFQILFNKFL